MRAIIGFAYCYRSNLPSFMLCITFLVFVNLLFVILGEIISRKKHYIRAWGKVRWCDRNASHSLWCLCIISHNLPFCLLKNKKQLQKQCQSRTIHSISDSPWGLPWHVLFCSLMKSSLLYKNGAMDDRSGSISSNWKNPTEFDNELSMRCLTIACWPPWRKLRNACTN